MRLLKVELKRFWARRLTWVAFVGLVGLVIVSAVGTFFSLAPPSAQEMQWMEESYQSTLEDWEANGDEYYQQCLADEAAEREANDGGTTWNWDCESNLEPPNRDDWLSIHPSFSDEAERDVEGYGVLLGFAALIVGASFFAAEMATGAISNWLTFEPRRTRVYLSKLGAAALGIIPIAVTSLAVSVAATWLVYAARDLLGSPDADLWRVVTLTAVRITLLMIATAVIGSALGAITRHTAAVIGLAVGWVVVDQLVFFGIFPRFQQWSGLNNLQAWIANGTMYYADKCTVTANGRECQTVESTLSMAHGGVYLAVLTALAVAVGLLIFRRRDVA
jgi:ABC-2 type transport system permease protein